MIAAAPVDTSAAANAVPTAGTPASAAPAGFDAILLLQSLAATSETLEGAEFEASDTTESLAGDDSDDDDDELESSLAFLSALITATTPQGSSQGSSQDSAGDLGSGAGGQGAFDDAAPLLALKADTGSALDADAGRMELLAGLVTSSAESQEHQAGDASQNLARAAELLALSQRAAATEVSKPSVLTHARDPRWADDFSARVSLMVRAGESTASLQLTPVDLGPVEVNVTVKDSNATIHFGASQADTRALIEASLPKLRELLASQGFNLMDASVSSGFSRSQKQEFASGSRGSADSDPVPTEVQAVRSLGLLDLYA